MGKCDASVEAFGWAGWRVNCGYAGGYRERHKGGPVAE